MCLQRSLRILRKSIFETRARLAATRRGARLAPGKLRVPREGEGLSQTFLLERAEELGPVFKVWLPHKMTTCIVGHDIARRFLSETEGRIRAGTPDLSPLFPHGFLRALEGDVHRTYRRRILDAFNATPLDAHEAELRAILRDGLARLAAAPQPVSNGTIRATMKAMTTAVFLRLILGVARGTARYDAFVSAYDVYAPDGPFLVVRNRHKPAYDAIRSLVDLTIADIEADPDARPSLLRHLIRSGTVNDTTLGNLVQMVEATRYDLHGLWTWILKHLGDTPAAVDLALRNAPGRNGGCPAVAAIPRESLRLEQSELLLRVALEDIVFDGIFIPRGSHIRICVWEAHHDPARHTDPFTFRCERFMDGKVPASLYAPFGLDKHRCLGADWTYDLSTLLVEELTLGYRWSISGDGQPIFGKFHFEPSHAFAVTLR